MSARILRRFLAAAAAFALAVAGVQAVSAGPAAAAEPGAAVRTLYYDASRAAEFQGAVTAAVQIWNRSVTNVRLAPGTPANFTIYADNGWPRAQTTRLGNGRIWMGRQAVNQGHNPTRIAAHEIGHILGLPDRRTGLCTDLMSGASAGTSCTNAVPNAREKAEVEAKFRGRTAAAALFGTAARETVCVY
jgi:snapalysin